MSKLRIAVLVGEEGIRKWQRECLDILCEIISVSIVAVCQRKNRSSQKDILTEGSVSIKKYVRRFLFTPPVMRREKIPTWLNKIPFRGITTSIEGGKERFSDKDLQWIESHKPDLILRFGFGILTGKILNIASQGVWSFHHGDLEKYRGRPPAFWELYEEKNRVGITLQKLSEQLDAGEIIERAFVPVARGSYRQTLERCYGQSAYLLKKAVIKCVNGNIRYRKPAQLGELYRNPDFRQLLLFVWILLTDWIEWFLEKAFWEYDWKVGVVDRDSIDVTGSNDVSPQWMPGPDNGFYADPGFSPVNENELLVEYWSAEKRKGEIQCLNLSGNGQPRTVLDLDIHLSFPKVYRVDEQYWLVPETGEAGQQLAFPLNDKCIAVKGDSKVLQGLEGVDPVLLYHNNKWWAFNSPKGDVNCYYLRLYFSDHFLGPYKPHPMNPITIDSYGARMAGAILEKGGSLFRFGQVYGKRYGEGVDIFEIEGIDEINYSEKRVGRVRMDGSSEHSGLHSLEMGNHKAVLDGYELQFHWQAGLNRLLAKLR